jgi:hypothetical protein
MNIIKIKLTKLDLLKEILAVISQPEIPQKIIFICSGSIPLLAETGALKKIRKTAQENNKEIEFINSQKFTRDILKTMDFNIYSKCPSDYTELEEKNITDLYKKKSLPIKNKEISRKKEIQSTAKEIVEEKLKNTFTKHQIHNPGRKKTSRSMIFFILISILSFLGGIILWITPKAIITIKPTLSPIPVIQNIIIALPDAEIDKTEEELPTVSGVFIGTTISGRENFTASGRKYDIENAHGKVTLFNETNKPKFLIPSRLSTEDGLIFRFKNKVTIPAKNGNKAGEKVVEIIADPFDEKNNPIGYRGNIIAGTELFFPALRNDLHELYYAKANKGPLVGGSTFTHYFVTKEDQEKSAKFLQDVLQTKAINNLKTENLNQSIREKKQYVLLKNKDLLISNFYNFVFPTDLIGQETETFEVSGELKLSGIVFDQDIVEKILLKKLNAILDDRQQLINLDNTSINYNILDYENFKEKKYLKLSIKAIGIKSLDFTVNTKDSLEWVQKIKKQIIGKNINQTKSILINLPEIEQVLDIKISPFWSNKIPKILNRIQLKIKKIL